MINRSSQCPIWSTDPPERPALAAALQPAGPFESLLLSPPKIHQTRNVSKLETGYPTQLDPPATCVSPIGAVLLFEDS